MAKKTKRSAQNIVSKKGTIKRTEKGNLEVSKGEEIIVIPDWIAEMKFDKSDSQKKLILACLEKSVGIISYASVACNISRQTIYLYIKEDEVFRAAVASVNDVALDMAESELYKAIQRGNIAAVIFLLKTRGKKRGYTDRLDIKVEGSTPVKVEHNLDLSKLSPDELRDFIQLFEKSRPID